MHRLNPKLFRKKMLYSKIEARFLIKELLTDGRTFFSKKKIHHRKTNTTVPIPQSKNVVIFLTFKHIPGAMV